MKQISLNGPPATGSIQLDYLTWAGVRARLGFDQSQRSKTAGALAQCYREAGLRSLFASMGFDWRAIAAITLHETGYGTSVAAYHNNLWGISYYSKTAGKMLPYAYDTMAQCCEHLLKTFAAPRYLEAMMHKANGPAFLDYLNGAGYNSSEAWRKGVQAAYNQLLQAS